MVSLKKNILKPAEAKTNRSIIIKGVDKSSTKGIPIPANKPKQKVILVAKARHSVGNCSKVAMVRMLNNIYKAALVDMVTTYRA